MYPACRAFVLHWLKVPPEPHPPAGAPASLRVFRAGKNFLKLRLLAWAVAQLIAFGGIIFWTVILVDVEHTVREQRVARASTPPPPAPVNFREALESAAPPSATPPPATKGKSSKQRPRINDWATFKGMLVNLALQLPAWMFPLIWVVKVAGILAYLAQIPLTYAIRRLDYEMRWYIVTDRSLRLRSGVWQVQELTMSFANLQQVTVSQGPLQRLLGLSDLRVQTAGGGGGDSHEGKQTSLHLAEFHGVENAAEIRDLILDRLRLFRAAGLGDPDDAAYHVTVAAVPPLPPPASSATLAAAHELLVEARALRRALSASR